MFALFLHTLAQFLTTSASCWTSRSRTCVAKRIIPGYLRCEIDVATIRNIKPADIRSAMLSSVPSTRGSPPCRAAHCSRTWPTTCFFLEPPNLHTPKPLPPREDWVSAPWKVAARLFTAVFLLGVVETPIELLCALVQRPRSTLRTCCPLGAGAFAWGIQWTRKTNHELVNLQAVEEEKKREGRHSGVVGLL